jgi:hypothetical protein
MKMRRLVLPVQEAKPGMQLSSDVRGPGGAVLLAAGAVLGEDALAGLRRRGIDAVSVDIPEARSEAEIALELARAEARIEHLFHRHIDNPELRELMQVVLDYRRKTLA